MKKITWAQETTGKYSASTHNASAFIKQDGYEWIVSVKSNWTQTGTTKPSLSEAKRWAEERM